LPACGFRVSIGLSVRDGWTLAFGSSANGLTNVLGVLTIAGFRVPDTGFKLCDAGFDASKFIGCLPCWFMFIPQLSSLREDAANIGYNRT
jgi:hypothetical protein